MNEIVFGNISELEEGKVLSKRFGRDRIAISKYKNNIYAFKDACTHDNAPLDQGEIKGCIITCPRHGAKFDITNGNVLSPPAILPLTIYKANIDNGIIKVILEDL
jgi:3-phenylpropionate/trans-cinnamate dioxygenase ferredoxin subunit